MDREEYLADLWLDDPRNRVAAEPVRLTRAALIGHNMRIAKTYGYSVLGCRIALAYERAQGCRDSILEFALAAALKAGRRGFQNIHGHRMTLDAKRIERIRRRLEREQVKQLEAA